MMPALPTPTQRKVLQRLRTDEWQSFAKLNFVVGDRLSVRLVDRGWVERRCVGGAIELKLTTSGLEALRAKLPTRPQHAGKVPFPKPQVRPED
jgi:hypothetical protein